MKKTVLAALILGVFTRARAADDCKPMKTDDEKLSWYCLQHPELGSDCAAVGRLQLPYISDYANCSGVDDAGRALDEDPCHGPSPLPPGCATQASSPHATPPGAVVPPGATTPGPKPVTGTGAWQPPTTCQPKKVGDVTVFMAQRCLFSPPQAEDGGHAPVSWGSTGKVGSGVAIFFTPKEGEGEFHSIGTPAVPSSPNCQVDEDIFDRNGNPMGKTCHMGGLTNDNGIALRWYAGDAKYKGGCKLDVGGQYYMVYRLNQRVPNPYASEGLQDLCGFTVDASMNIVRY